MKKFALVIALLGIAYAGFAQLNTTLVSNFDYEMRVNDVWGYVAPDGTEYALVGLQEGVSVVSLQDPAQPEEVAFAPGPSSTWRDMKTWGEHAYTINESDDGLLVMDLSMLPDSMSYYYWSPVIPELDSAQLTTCHNLYIDESGYAYLAGCDVNSGGPIFVDVFSDPGNPIYVGKSDARYAHDVYARDNLLYGSDIYQGSFSIMDVSDKSNPVLLASQETPFQFTHNAWLSDDGNTIFTTDERADAPTAAYDISDYDNIRLLDEFRPGATVGRGVVPHNTHVLNDYLITSHYTDGVVIVDASRPSNMIEVGSYDTYQGGDGGFSGCWGAYPFLPSGLILGSDRDNGLFVLRPDYKRACYLEGLVKNAETGALLSDVEVAIDSDNSNFKTTDLNGAFATGQVTAGTFDVVFSKFGFEDKVMQVDLANGVVTELEVELEPLGRFIVSGQAVADASGNPIANAQVAIVSENITYNTLTDENGQFNLADVVEDNYQVIVGAWGYLHATSTIAQGASEGLSYRLEAGYQDDFALDLGWTVESDASTGIWELGEPIGTGFGQFTFNPGQDFAADIGNSCYVTGNGGGGAGDDDVDDGSTILTSPPMDLTNYNAPILSYYRWFMNGGGNGTPDDQLEIRLSNGTDEVVLETINEPLGLWSSSAFILNDVGLPLTDNMRLIVETGDLGEGHLLEAGLDAFSVIDDMPSNVNETLAAAVQLDVLPNPFTDNARIHLQLPRSVSKVELRIYNILGQLVQQQAVSSTQVVSLGASLTAGTYFVSIAIEGEVIRTEKLIKQ